MRNIQSAGAGYYAGKGEKSKKKLKGLRSSINNELKSLMGRGGSFKQDDFEESIAYLDDELEEIEGGSVEGFFTFRGDEYFMADVHQATEAVQTYTEETLWAFKAEFLENYIPLEASTIKILQEQCEGCNDELLNLAKDSMTELVAEAISSDGYGHFLNDYSGEHEEFEFVKTQMIYCEMF